MGAKCVCVKRGDFSCWFGSPKCVVSSSGKPLIYKHLLIILTILRDRALIIGRGATKLRNCSRHDKTFYAPPYEECNVFCFFFQKKGC